MHKKIFLLPIFFVFVFLFQSNAYSNLMDAGIYGINLSKEELDQKIKSEIRNETTHIITNRLFQGTAAGFAILLTATSALGLYIAATGDNAGETAAGLALASIGVCTPMFVAMIVDTQNWVLNSKERIGKLEKLQKQHCV